MVYKKEISASKKNEMIAILHTRFVKNKHLHKNIEWPFVLSKLENKNSSQKLWSLHQMEATGGEPDVVGYDSKTNDLIFFDCAAESPTGRRSLCYDREGLDSRKEFKPQNSAIDMANEMGVMLLSEEEYRYLQSLGNFDLKTSSWLKTPDTIRKLGGSLFGDKRYNTVFIYHNGAQSYYASRGFRGVIKL